MTTTSNNVSYPETKIDVESLKTTVQFLGENEKYLFNNNILRIHFGPRALPDFVNTVTIPHLKSSMLK